MTTETDQTVTTNTLDETLQHIEISQDTLNRITQDIGWGELTQFTNAQVEQLQRIQTDHVTHGWAYVEAYLRQEAQGFNVSPEEFDQLAAAINASGKCLVDYRESFNEVLTRFCNGESLEDCVALQSKQAPPNAPPQTVTEADLREAAKSIPNADIESMVKLVQELARGNARASCDTIVGFAEMEASSQEFMRQTYIDTYQLEICEILRSDAFKTRIEAAQTPALGGNQEEQKKMLERLLYGTKIQGNRSLPSSAGSSSIPTSDKAAKESAIDTKDSNLPKES